MARRGGRERRSRANSHKSVSRFSRTTRPRPSISLLIWYWRAGQPLRTADARPTKTSPELASWRRAGQKVIFWGRHASEGCAVYRHGIQPSWLPAVPDAHHVRQSSRHSLSSGLISYPVSSSRSARIARLSRSARVWLSACSFGSVSASRRRFRLLDGRAGIRAAALGRSWRNLRQFQFDPVIGRNSTAAASIAPWMATSLPCLSRSE
jgi:hypothetical protein